MSEITVGDLDCLVSKFLALRDDYEEKSKISKEASAALDAAEAELLDKLKEVGKTKYHVDGIGSVSKVSRISFKTPKSPDDKKKLFAYIDEKYGPEVLMGMLSINSQSLNSFFKEASECPPGLEAPTSMEYLKFSRS